MIKVTVQDIGRSVTYTPFKGCDPSAKEEGVITSFNDDFIFVKYGINSHSQATNKEDLMWKVNEFKDWNHCYYCGNEMTKEDHANYDPKPCCSGRDCGCMGLPTEPPYCIKCSKGSNG